MSERARARARARVCVCVYVCECGHVCAACLFLFSYISQFICF